MNDSEEEEIFDPIADYETMDFTLFTDLDPVLFPSFQKSTGKVLFVILFHLIDAQMTISGTVRMPIYYVSLLINSIHLLVLTRKSMRDNAINILLASIAINDIFITVLAAFADIKNEAVGKIDISRIKTNLVDIPVRQLITLNVAKFLKRNGVWLPIIMAATRAIVMKNFDNAKLDFLTTTTFGIASAMTEIFINFASVLSVFLIMTDWGVPDKKGFYQLSVKSLKIYSQLDPFIGFTIPSLCYPLLTLILLHAMKSTKGKVLSVRNDKGKTRSSEMILMITILFMISELPQGIAGALTVFNGGNQGLYYIFTAVSDLFGYLSALNASTHFFICLKMSSNYRDAFLKMIRREKKNKSSGRPISPVYSA